MAIYEADGLTLKGQVQRGYTLGVAPTTAYEYLSDIKTLLAQVPNVSKIQVGKNSGRARAFFNLAVMGFMVDAVLDIEPTYDREQLSIRLKNATEPLGPIPSGYFTGKFNSLIKVVATERGTTRVTSQIALAFDGQQLIERGILNRYVLETSGPALLQQYCERLCDDYIINLLENFRKWLTQRSQ